MATACRTARNGILPLPAFDMEGHRGCRGLMPENTLLGMMKAIDLGVTTLEMDVVMTADSQVICSHEPYFNHEITTRPNGTYVSESEEKALNIFRMSYADVIQYDVGLKPHPRFPRQEKVKAVKPLLAELIDEVEAYRQLRNRKKVFYNIETKTNPQTDGIYHPAPEVVVEALLRVIRDKKIIGRTIIQSFDYRTLQLVHKAYPMLRLSALVEEGDKRTLDEHLAALGFQPAIYCPPVSHVNDSLVRACKDKKIKLVVWTVNDAQEIERLQAMGVDGIITDYPDLFTEKVKNKK